MDIVQIAVLIVFFTITQTCLAAKIAFLPNFGRSHFLVLGKLAAGLQAKGHKVVIVVGGECTYAVNNPIAKIFKVSDEFLQEHKEQEKMFTSESLSEMPAYVGVIFLNIKQTQYCDFLLSDQTIINDLKTADIIVGDSLYPCSYLVADMLDKPHATVHMIRHIGILPGTTNYPSYVPQYGSLVPSNMGLVDKIYNLKVYLENLYVTEAYVYPGYEKVKIRHNIKPQKSIKETMKTVDLILLEKDFTLQYAQPLPPYIKETGSFMAGPSKPLPGDIEQFIESSGEDGVLLVSFGSMIDSLEINVLRMMNDAFSMLPQKVLWRLNFESIPFTLSKNTKAMQWLPQNDILGHNKTKLFITHAGANGMAEAFYHGVPMLCSPFFGDQFDNSAFIKNSGLGLVSRVNIATSEQFASDIQTILNDKRYRERSYQVSEAIKMRKRSSVDEAVDLVEYVLAVGNLSHLKPRGETMPFYQLYMLDVLGVLAVFILIVSILVITCLHYIYMSYKNCFTNLIKTKTS